MQIRTNIKQANKIKELIKKECANYVGGNCILLDTTCPQMGCIYSVLCKYFINSVLPLDKELYKELLEGAGEETGLYTKQCKLCKKQFTTDKKNVLYCDKCKDKRRKETRRNSYYKNKD